MNVRFRRQFYQRPEGDDPSTGGGGVDVGASDVGGVSDAAGVEASTAEVAAPTPAPEPATALEAIERALETPEQKAERARDELGRFTKAQEEAAAKAAAVEGKPAAAAQPTEKPAPGAKPGQADLTMPEGLQPKAQQRFQALANEIKELRPQFERAQAQLTWFTNTVAEHQIKPEQFDLAVQTIGLMNKGDYQGALKVLDEQRQMIALAMGQPLPDVDPLANFPDLQQAVTEFRVSREYAMEVAKARFGQHQAQQATQARQRQEEQAKAQQQQAETYRAERQQAEADVAEFCTRMQRTDLDFAAISAQLEPIIPSLLEGVPCTRWKQVVETQYRLLKNAASQFRQPVPGGGTSPMRGHSQPSPGAKPSNAYEAMFGEARPTA